MLPEVLKAMVQFQAEMAKHDESIQILLKGHLLLEAALTRILEQHAFHPEHLDDLKLGFHQRATLARSLCLRKNQLGEWELIFALNALRNEIAHNLNSPNRAKKIDRVKEIYFREANVDEADPQRTGADAVIVLNACAHCAGFLSVFESDARAFRQLIHGMDRAINPSLPAFDL